MNEEVKKPFDDDSRDEDSRACVGHMAAQTLEDLIQIGRNLAEVRACLSSEQFGHGLDAEFGMALPTANRSLCVYELFSGRWTTGARPSPGVLYELIAPSTSDTIIEQVQMGQIPPTVQAIKAAKEAERQARREREVALQELERLRVFQARIARLSAEVQCLQREWDDFTMQNVETRKERVAPPDELECRRSTGAAQVRTMRFPGRMTRRSCSPRTERKQHE